MRSSKHLLVEVMLTLKLNGPDSLKCFLISCSIHHLVLCPPTKIETPYVQVGHIFTEDNGPLAEYAGSLDAGKCRKQVSAADAGQCCGCRLVLRMQVSAACKSVMNIG
eukprot:scaffold107132_cov19-Tisochrysis_lutea.AAC.1